jgi:hypothetical protein
MRVSSGHVTLSETFWYTNYKPCPSGWWFYYDGVQKPEEAPMIYTDAGEPGLRTYTTVNGNIVPEGCTA